MSYLRTASLENPGLWARRGWTGWNDKGRLLITTEREAALWKRRPAYFRVNATGKFYAVISRERTEEVPATSIDWRALEVKEPRQRPRVDANQRELL